MAGKAVCNTARSAARKGTRRYGQKRQEMCGYCQCTFWVDFGYTAVYCSPRCKNNCKYFRRYWREKGVDPWRALQWRQKLLVERRRDALQTESAATESTAEVIVRSEDFGADREAADLAALETRYRVEIGAAQAPAKPDKTEFCGFRPTDMDALAQRLRRWQSPERTGQA